MTVINYKRPYLLLIAKILAFTIICVLSYKFSLKDVCKKATLLDQNISNILNNPKKEHKAKIMKYIKSYINEVEKVVVGLMMKVEIGSKVKRFIETGDAGFMNTTLQLEELEETFQWSEKQMKEFKELREGTRLVWMKLTTQYSGVEEVITIE